MNHLIEALVEGLPMIFLGGLYGYLYGKTSYRVDKLEREVMYLKHRHMHLLKGGDDEKD